MLIAEDGPANAEHKRTVTFDQCGEGQLPRLAMAVGKPLQKLTVGERADCSQVEQRMQAFPDRTVVFDHHASVPMQVLPITVD